MSSTPADTDAPKNKSTVHWREVVMAWQTSGLSISQFCRQQQLSDHQLYYYRQKYLPASKPKEATPKPAGFAKVAVSAVAAVSDDIVLHLPNGMVLSGLSAQQPSVIADIIKALS